MAVELVKAIEAPFDPAEERYRDTYHDDLLALIQRKEQGLGAPEAAAAGATPETGEVIDIVGLLKRSIEAARANG